MLGKIDLLSLASLDPACRFSAASLLAVLVVSDLVGCQSLQAQTLHTQPIQVLLHWRAIDGSAANPKKLGIYASIGDSPSPQIFEFDTGGQAFSPPTPAARPAPGGAPRDGQQPQPP